MVTEEPSSSPALPRVTSRIQLGWGTTSSGVSSMLTILALGLMNTVIAFNKVVLPEAVSPEIKVFIP